MGVAGGKVPEVASGLNTIVKLVDNIERICTDHVGNVYLSLRRKSTDSDVALIYICQQPARMHKRAGKAYFEHVCPFGCVMPMHFPADSISKIIVLA